MKKYNYISFCYMLFSFNHMQANQYLLLSTNCCLRLMEWKKYLAITLESFLFQSSINLINGVCYMNRERDRERERGGGGGFLRGVILTRHTGSLPSILSVSAEERGQLGPISKRVGHSDRLGCDDTR